MRKTVLVTLFLALALTLTACVPVPQAAIQAAQQPAAAPKATAPAVASGQNGLAGTSWTLATLNGQAPVKGTTVTASFGKDGLLAGSDGCNAYSTSYTADATNLKVDPKMATTMLGCADPITNQANAYTKALLQAATYKIDGTTLTLLDSAGKSLLTYGTQATGLAGTSWQAIGYNNGKQAVVSVANGTTITANFGQDGRLSGNAGCNDYAAAYTTQGPKITISAVASTQKACEQAVMDQETAYLAAMQTAATYRMDAGKLELRNADGALAANFSAQATGLAGTSWEATGYNNGKQAVVSVALGSAITASFGQDGMLTGNAGCNDYNATYKVQDQTISIGPIAATRKACEQAVMDQETAYLAAMQTATTYRMDAGKLELRNADGALQATYIAKAG